MIHFHAVWVDDILPRKRDDAKVLIDDAVMTHSVGGRRIKESGIQLDIIPTGDDAIAFLKKQDWVDLLLLDLSFPENEKAAKSNRIMGLEVLRKIDVSRIGRVAVVSQFAHDAETLGERTAADRESIDDWLVKEHVMDGAESEKLARLAVPAKWIAHVLAGEAIDSGEEQLPDAVKKKSRKKEAASHPLFFQHPSMLKLLAEIYLLAQTRVPVTPKVGSQAWPLTRLLLLGPAGCGKSALAEAFHRLLPPPPPTRINGELQRSDRADFVPINCASLVGDAGHGGRMALFGENKFNQKGPAFKGGVFSRATRYMGNELQDARSEYAGTVFLDEIVELHPVLQASLLNCLEEGTVTLEGDRVTVDIACHVVAATNRHPEELVGSDDPGERNDAVALRSDLMDRMYTVLTVPSLRERGDEAISILKGLAALRLNELGSATEFDEKNAPMPADPPVALDKISMSLAFENMLNEAMRLKRISSVRQLQAIARTLRRGETRLTDVNLAPVFRKMALMGQSRETAHEQAMLDRLGIPGQLNWETLTPEAQEAVRLLNLLVDKKCKLEVKASEIQVPDSTDKRRVSDAVWLLISLMQKSDRHRFVEVENETSLQAHLTDVRSRRDCVHRRGDTVHHATLEYLQGRKR